MLKTNKFQNRSVQIYAFSHKYSEYTLNAICEALLGDSKIEFEGDISELPMNKLAQYCLKDAYLTLKLTSFNDNLLMKLLVVIARIGRLSIYDIARLGLKELFTDEAGKWLKSLNCTIVG